MHRVEPLPLPQPQLSIAGNYTGIHEHPVFRGDSEVWVFNGPGMALPRCDLVFQMHLECDWGDYGKMWMENNTEIPVMMRELRQDIPMSVQYPFEKVFEMLEGVIVKGEPLQYFTSTIAWAIALAVLQKRPRVQVIGIELKEAEYIKQKDCFTFWVGFAAGRGTKLEIDCAEEIFKQPLYGSYPLQ